VVVRADRPLDVPLARLCPRRQIPVPDVLAERQSKGESQPEGEEIGRRGIEAGEITPETEVVVIWFDAVKEGGSARLRIEETYTDPNRYLAVAPDELVWDRSFGRSRNTVILPEGWYLTANAVPAVIDQTAEGLTRLRYINDRPGDIEVFIRARRR
jgi:hypothetical protein